MAIGRRTDEANVILIEEPENHLSYVNLRKLIHRIEESCCSKQVIIATHSTYVLNKLGLENLILLDTGKATRITELPQETINYFKKLPGYDTLRLVLSEKTILVEGPSDELVVQRGYKDAKGKPPIEDGIDVISVGLSHKRFLDLAIRLKRRVWVVTDNDGKTLECHGAPQNRPFVGGSKPASDFRKIVQLFPIPCKFQLTSHLIFPPVFP